MGYTPSLAAEAFTYFRVSPFSCNLYDRMQVRSVEDGMFSWGKVGSG